MPTQTKIRASTIERLLDDVEHWAERLHRLREKMRRLRAGSSPYVDQLPELTVELNWLDEKVRSASQAIEEFLDALPDDGE